MLRKAGVKKRSRTSGKCCRKGGARKKSRKSAEDRRRWKGNGRRVKGSAGKKSRKNAEDRRKWKGNGRGMKGSARKKSRKDKEGRRMTGAEGKRKQKFGTGRKWRGSDKQSHIETMEALMAGAVQFAVATCSSKVMAV